MFELIYQESVGTLLTKENLDRMAVKKIKQIQETRTSVNSHLNVSITTISVTNADDKKTKP
jgi:hypothetical protein